MLQACRTLRFTSWRALKEVQHYDVCVIGAGPAGIAAALRAVDYKKKVCLIERNRIGGYDLWNGALQSKTLWSFSNFFRNVRGPAGRRLYGEPVDSCLEVNETEMQATMEKVSSTREGQIRVAIEATDTTLLFGQATFISDHEVACYSKETKELQKVTADYFIIATGSKPRKHPFAKVDGSLVVTSDHIMKQPLPEKLVIVGAGVIGCEFASIFSGLGKTKVAIIDKAPHILPNEDRDMVSRVEEQMMAQGVTVHHDSALYDLQTWEASDEELQDITSTGLHRRGVQYTIMDRKTQQLTTYHVDRALISIGREPHYGGLGLESTSLKTQDGRLLVDEFGKCVGRSNVFAIGDASSRVLLVSMAEAKAKLVVDYIYGTAKLDPPHIEDSLSRVSFLTKTIASVGLNEVQCRKRNIAYMAAKVGYDLVSRPVAADNVDGFVKIIVSNDPQRRIIGVHALGMNSSTIVDLGSLAILRKQSAYDLADRLTAYPAVSQAFQECLRAILGRSQLKPGVFSSFTVTKWTPEYYGRGGLYQEEAERCAGDANSSGCSTDAGEEIVIEEKVAAALAGQTEGEAHSRGTGEERGSPESSGMEVSGSVSSVGAGSSVEAATPTCVSENAEEPPPSSGRSPVEAAAAAPVSGSTRVGEPTAAAPESAVPGGFFRSIGRR